MLEGHSIVCFTPNRWHDIWRNRQHIFSRLARSNRILYVEPEMATVQEWRRGRLGWRDLRRPGVEHLQDGLYLYRFPAWLPTSGRRPLRDLSHAAHRQHLRYTVRRLGFERPILWLFRPAHRMWLRTLHESLILYHVTDEYGAFDYWTEEQRTRLVADEKRLLREADLVIVTSPRLQETKHPIARSIALVPNGVDYEAFANASLRASEPLDVQPIPRPRLGYVGHISSRLDLDLLIAVAKARPDQSLVLVGSVWEGGCEEEMAALRSLPNVHILPPREGTAVPACAASFDVGLIPYRLSEEAESISPLKMYEYLAAGLPVVSSDIPAARQVSHLVRLAHGTEGWIEEIDAALAERDDATKVTARQALAQANDWSLRLEALSSEIEQALSEKASF